MRNFHFKCAKICPPSTVFVANRQSGLVVRVSFVHHRPETRLKKFNLFNFHYFFTKSWSNCLVAVSLSTLQCFATLQVFYVEQAKRFGFPASSITILKRGCECSGSEQRIYNPHVRLCILHRYTSIDWALIQGLWSVDFCFVFFHFEKLTCVLCCCMLSCNIVTYSIRTSRFLCSAMRKIKKAESLQLLWSPKEVEDVYVLTMFGSGLAKFQPRLEEVSAGLWILEYNYSK